MDGAESEPPLTVEEAYRATYHFVLQYYEREPIAPFLLMLSDMQLEGEHRTSDPAHWHDWLASVEKARSDETLPDPPPLKRDDG